jgi:hypothetical protein
MTLCKLALKNVQVRPFPILHLRRTDRNGVRQHRDGREGHGPRRSGRPRGPADGGVGNPRPTSVGLPEGGKHARPTMVRVRDGFWSAAPNFDRALRPCGGRESGLGLGGFEKPAEFWVGVQDLEVGVLPGGLALGRVDQSPQEPQVLGHEVAALLRFSGRSS